MNRINGVAIGLGVALTMAIVAPGAAAEKDSAPAAQAKVLDPAGSQTGSLLLREGPKGVWMRYAFRNLTPGWHAMHFHAVGDCSDAAFQKSGGHVNDAAGSHRHGLLNPDGPDFGDLPNFFVADDGTAQGEAFSPFVTLSNAAGRASLLDSDGSALVVHEALDDHQTQPIGGAGARVACGVLQPLAIGGPGNGAGKAAPAH